MLTKEPVSLPLTVLVVNATVGLDEVLHTIPLAVTAAPPLLVILPPDAAVMVVTSVTVVVVTVGVTGDAVSFTANWKVEVSVPSLLLAYTV